MARDIRKSRAHTGYIFQQFNLVNRLSVLENVLIGALGLKTNTFYFRRKEVRRWLFFVLKRPVIIRSCRTIT